MKGTFAKWAVDAVRHHLLVRMQLEHLFGSSQVGSEGVELGLLGYHWDDDGPVFGCLTYASDRVSKARYLFVDVVQSQDEAEALFGELTRSWEPAWQTRRTEIWQSRTTDSTGVKRPLEADSVLVIQHLARIQGHLGATQTWGVRKIVDYSKLSVAERMFADTATRAFLGTTRRNLDALIFKLNRERQAELEALKKKIH